MARFFILTGESSGDKLGAIVGKQLSAEGHQVEAWGGSQMIQEDINVVFHIDALKVMGWTGLLMKIPFYLSLLSKAKKNINTFHPDTLILIDFGSFNLRIAKWAKKQGYRVIYYSPPKVWATRSGRIEQLRTHCDHIIVLFPFEKDYFAQHGIPVDYFGHPFANLIDEFKADPKFKITNGLDDRPVLAILPGSRKEEIIKTLPVYLEAAREMNDHQICISCAEGMSAVIRSLSSKASCDLVFIENGYYDLLDISDLAIVTSGTATLETALFRVPQIVGYKASWLNYRVAKFLIKTNYISLPNLIGAREIVPELIQKELCKEKIITNLIRICQADAKSRLDNDYNGIINDIFIQKCHFNTFKAISAEKA